MKFLNWLNTRIYNQIYRSFYYPKIHKCMEEYNVCSVNDTINNLINTNKSLSRFGDGEVLWILGKSNISFEKNSRKLSKCLIKVLRSKDTGIDIALPSIFHSDSQYSSKDKRFYRLFMAKYGKNIFPYLKKNKQYYNTDVSRIYTSNRCNKSIAQVMFARLKKIWDNKQLLIIEGRGTRLGVNNDLFSNASEIKRIECPINNAFESYNHILDTSLKVLSGKSYLTLISLGPTATVLSYDIFKHGHRSIDVGHIDIEYEWYLMNTKGKTNIPTRYVNEVNNGTMFKKISNKKYRDEIIANI